MPTHGGVKVLRRRLAARPWYAEHKMRAQPDIEGLLEFSRSPDRGLYKPPL